MTGKHYLGDEVFVEVECGDLKLTTKQQGNSIQTVYLSPEAYSELIRYSNEALIESAGL